MWTRGDLSRHGWGTLVTSTGAGRPRTGISQISKEDRVQIEESSTSRLVNKVGLQCSEGATHVPLNSDRMGLKRHRITLSTAAIVSEDAPDGWLRRPMDDKVGCGVRVTVKGKRM